VEIDILLEGMVSTTMFYLCGTNGEREKVCFALILGEMDVMRCLLEILLAF
jgi:hypothetical protein